MRHQIDRSIEATSRFAIMDLGELNNTFGFLLRAAWRDVSRTFNYFFRNENITSAVYAVLILVERNPGCGPGDLVKPMGIGHNNLAQLLKELVKRKILTKKVSGEDRRAKVLQLTPTGKKLLTKLRSIHKDFEAEYARRVGKKHLNELTRILARFDVS